jgi:succinate dehydrogenase / fumarate reductase cytochrome b subunit
MAVTGLVLIAFLLMHMIGNLKMFIPVYVNEVGETVNEFNHYAEFLKQDLLYPILPKGVFIWIFRLVILACLVLHIYSAVTLWLRANRATASKYTVKKTIKQSFSSKWMRWGGILLALLLTWHLIQFTIVPTLAGDHDPRSLVIAAFQQPLFVAIYVAMMLVVYLHLAHGFGSAFMTLGANTSPKAERVLRVIAHWVAALILVGFVAMPFSVLAGVIN